jgi:hypothetical protein
MTDSDDLGNLVDVDDNPQEVDDLEPLPLSLADWRAQRLLRGAQRTPQASTSRREPHDRPQ